jgi:hypothetical protein
VEDRHLHQWRDFLAGQLHPGAAAQTVEVFARRAGISPTDFRSLLDSPAGMQAEVFARIPQARLNAYRRATLHRSIQLLHAYLGNHEFCADEAPSLSRERPGAPASARVPRQDPRISVRRETDESYRPLAKK